MNPEQFRKIEELFNRVMERKPEERRVFLAEFCNGDETLKKEVETLITAEESAGGFLQAAIENAAHDFFAAGGDAAKFQERIGNYRVLREIGRGGMGAVYLAERDDEIRKRVALKVIRRGMDSDDIIRRFRNERQILAALEHPNIARLLDGGTTEGGLPYFVMEYIEGSPLLDYCDRHKLSTAERLKLFRQICSAVSYAHQNLVVHRDLKPSNILVTADGIPKLLDFGIAKMLNPEIFDSTMNPTETAHQIMTPIYASPEQVRGEQITTASDVYSLGVLLYELLTGHRPYQIKNNTHVEIIRAVCETEPQRPSAIVNRIEEIKMPDGTTERVITPETVSRSRDVQTGKLQRQLSGDLDNIVLTALRKEPQRRYNSVERFSEDLRRHLEGLPVSARADTFRYRAEKFIARNRFTVAAGALATLALLVAVAVTLVQNSRIAAQRNVAEEQRLNAEKEKSKAVRVSAFLVDLFKGSKPKAKGEEVSAREILDRGADRVINELKDEPEIQAALLDTMANACDNMGLSEQALKLSRLALDIRRRTLGNENPETIRSFDTVGEAEFSRANYKEAQILALECLALTRKVLGESPELAESLNDAAVSTRMNDQWTEAEPLYREGIELSRKLLANKDARLASHSAQTYFTWAKPVTEIGLAYSLYNFGGYLRDMGKYDDAQAAYQESLEIFRRNEQADAEGLGYVLRGMGNLQSLRGDYENGEKSLRESVEIYRRTRGSEHSYVADSLITLGLLLSDKGDLQAAEEILREAMTLREKLSGKSHPQIAQILSSQARIEREKGNLNEAEKLFRQSHDLYQKLNGAENKDTARAKAALGGLLAEKNQAEAGETLVREGLIVLEKKLPADHWQIAEAHAELGICHLAKKDFAEAERLLKESLAAIKAKRGDKNQLVKRIEKSLSSL